MLARQRRTPTRFYWNSLAFSANTFDCQALRVKLKAIIINFHKGKKPPLDVDNMSKPILDAMNEFVYEDDRQISQAEITHVPIDDPFRFVGASKMLVDAVQAGKQFVYVRIEDAVDPFPLPK